MALIGLEVILAVRAPSASETPTGRLTRRNQEGEYDPLINV
jgi:hypothetical protein